jgi:polyribonucleotide nucleotidyltransferase
LKNICFCAIYNLLYSKQMAKPNLLIKLSGSLLENPEVFSRIKKESKKYSIVILAGGGESINKIFEEKGWKIQFCPLGRVTKTLEQRQMAKNILEKNQAKIQDLLDKKGISARVEIPVREHGNVLCHENGDVAVLSVYCGYDKILIFTKKSMVKAKRKWLKKVAECFQHIEPGELDKIEVVGF